MIVARFFLFLAAVSTVALLLAACRSDTVVPSGQAIVSDIPWNASEKAVYRLMDGDEEKGTGVLRIESRSMEVVLSQLFESEEFTDEVEAVANAETLSPQSVEHVITGPDGTRRWRVEYHDGRAIILQRSGDDERRDELAVPSRSYDSWTDVFLWRTIDFRSGFTAAYVDVLSATLSKPQVISQTLEVVARGTVEVPAGTYEAWELEIRSDEGTQRAWYADTETRPLVRYDNGSLVFELVSIQ